MTEDFGYRKCEDEEILDENNFGKCRIKQSLLSLNPDETKRSLSNLNLKKVVRIK